MSLSEAGGLMIHIHTYDKYTQFEKIKKATREPETSNVLLVQREMEPEHKAPLSSGMRKEEAPYWAPSEVSGHCVS